MLGFVLLNFLNGNGAFIIIFLGLCEDISVTVKFRQNFRKLHARMSDQIVSLVLSWGSGDAWRGHVLWTRLSAPGNRVG